MRRLLILALLMCGAVYAYAGPVEFTFLEWNEGAWQDGYPYYITPTNGPTSGILAVMCDDYIHGGLPGQQWYANITDLGSGNITLTRFDNVVGPYALYPLHLYDEAGWLLLQTQVNPTSDWMEMTYAVWNIFDPSSPCDSTCQAWIAAAQSGVIGLHQSYFNDVYIVTPVNQHDPDPNSMQEFMYIGASSSSGLGNDPSVPEPGTLWLLGTGLVAVLRRRFLN